jgi:hypothetical protein
MVVREGAANAGKKKIVPDYAADVEVLAGLDVGEHVALQRRAHPVRPIRAARLVRVDEHGIALCDGHVNPCNLCGREERSISFDECEWVVIDRKADCSERS